MDEIICPECGRPNLVEAERCWYCQIPLVSKENISEESSEADAEMEGNDPASSRSPVPEENEENLPEWLKRIRELKKADTPIEEVDEWQQEKLFPGLTQDADGPAARSEPPRHPPRGYERNDTKPVIPEGQPMLDGTPFEGDHDEKVITEESAAQDENEPGDMEDELPEGFTPLEH